MDLAIAEVAEKCGFSDPSHFARRFRKRFGVTPIQYRRALRLPPPPCRP